MPCPRSRRVLIVLAVLALMAAACGSNRTAEDIELAAQGIIPQPDQAGAAVGSALAGGGATTSAATTGAVAGAGEGDGGGAGATGGTGSATAGTAAGSGGTTGTAGQGGGTTTAAPSPGSATSPGGASSAGGAAGGGTTAAGSSGAGGGPAGDGAAAPAETGSTGGEAPAPADASGPKSPIRIGSVGALSGPAGAVLAPIPEAIQVWAAAINASGGVNGHPVEVLVADDGGDPRRQRELTQQYVEQQGVIAFVGNPSALSQQGSIDYLEQVGVPIVGSDGALDIPYETPILRPQQAHGTSYGLSAINAIGSQAQAAGLTRWGSVTCVELASCRQGAQTLAEIAPNYGAEVVYSTDASLTQPDFTAECLNAQAAGAEMLQVVLDGASLARLASSCARQGYSPTYSTLATALTDAVRTNADLDGMLIGGATPLWTEDVTPAVAEMRQAFATYAPNATIQPSSIVGWTAAKLFEAATQALPEPATSQDIIDGLNAIQGDDLGGLTYPLAFTAGEVAPRVHCWFEIQIQGGQFVTGPSGPGILCE